jgi:hypothetical protein
MTVLHQGMAHVAQLRRLTVALLVKPRLRVTRALMRVVGALLLVEAVPPMFAVLPSVLLSSTFSPITGTDNPYRPRGGSGLDTQKYQATSLQNGEKRGGFQGKGRYSLTP